MGAAAMLPVLVALVVAFAAPAATGATLRIGAATTPAGVDPHVAVDGAGRALAHHLFDRLIEVDAGGRLVPGLARSWRVEGGRRWIFSLAARARFHDGSAVEAGDVVASLTRAAREPQAAGAGLGGIEVEALDPHTVAVTTAAPDATLPAALAAVAIAAGDEHGMRHDERGALIGSGPYRLVDFQPGAALRLERYEGYWRGKPEWTEVTIEAVHDPVARAAGLAAGHFDLVEDWRDPAPAGATVTLARTAGDRLLYLQLDQGREQSPYVTALDGTAIANPLRDPRVRRAISLAIDRDLLSRAIYGASARPAGQLVPPGALGYDASLAPPKPSPEEARALLAEAGFPDGFKVTVHCPHGRYPEDERVCAVVAQMLTDVGIETTAVTLAPDAFFRRATRGGKGGVPEFSALLLGWLAGPSGAASPLAALVHSFAPERGLGRSNRGRFASDAIDALIEQALGELDRSRRAGLLALATERALDDTALVPLYFQRATWATRAGIGYRPRADTLTLAMDAYSE